MECESANIDFPCAKLEPKKNVPQIFFGDYKKPRNSYWLKCLDLHMCQILWKMS